MKLTIATVTKNCLEYTKIFLSSLKKNLPFPCKIIVVDNNSTDGTQNFLKEQKDITVIFNKRNLGFGRANNQAFKLCDTKYFLGINNDTIIFPNFIKELIKIAEKHKDFGEIGVNSNCIGAKNPFTNTKIENDLKKIPAENPAKILSVYYKNPKKFFQAFKTKNNKLEIFESPPNFIGGWCFLVRKKTVEKIEGLFDPRFKIGFWEDVDLSWRIAKIGYKIVLAKGIYLHHFNHISFKNNKLRLTDKQISRENALKFAEKWEDEIKNFLTEKFKQGLSLKQIVHKYFIFASFFGKKRKDWESLEEKLKSKVLKTEKISFKNFLLLTRKKQKNKTN